MRFFTCTCFLFFLLTLALWGTEVPAASVSDFLDFSDAGLPGRLYVPPEAATSAEPRPLILFLHGAGETGTNNSAQVNGNIDNLLENAKSRGAFLYAPQATTFNWQTSSRPAQVMSKIDEALSQYNIDNERLYVTGLSMGGGGVWSMLNRFDDRFAAGVPIAAVSPAADFEGGNLVGKPTWAFHARDDNVVSSAASQQAVSDVIDAGKGASLTFPGGSDGRSTVLYTNEQIGINYTEFATGGHGIWTPVYDTPEMYDWMFSKTLMPTPTVEPAGGAQVVVLNDRGQLLIGDSSGNAIPGNSGFVAVGSFSISDEAIAETNSASLSTLQDAFTQFGSSDRFNPSPQAGLFAAYIGAPLTSEDPLPGETIYLVAGDGDDIGSSESLFIFKSDETFTNVDPLTSPSSLTPIILGRDLDSGDILLGEPGDVFYERFSDFFPGIIGASVTVPEPTTLVLVLGVVCSVPRRRA